MTSKNQPGSGQKQPSQLSSQFADDNTVDAARGDRVKEAIRRIGGITHASLVTGVPIRTLSNYQAGGSMKLGNATALARAAKVSLEWMATGEGEMQLSGLAEEPARPVAKLAQSGGTRTYMSATTREHSKVLASALAAAETMMPRESANAKNRIEAALIMAENFLETAGKERLPVYSVTRLALALEMVEEADAEQQLTAQERCRYMLNLYHHHEALIAEKVAPELP